MNFDSEQLEAAKAVSEALDSLNIQHAFIGAFASRLMGHDRTCNRVDVGIDISTYTAVEVSKRLNKHGDLKRARGQLLYLPEDWEEESQVPIEITPLWPLVDSRTPRVIEVRGVTVLHPAIHVLMDVNLCVQYIGSTSPLSIYRLHQGLSDTEFQLQWLKQHNEKIDFSGYQSDRDTVKDLVDHWRTKNRRDLVDLLDSVLQPEDSERIMQV
ncbi:uncharacterized protein F4822DRAFT_427820 [Hypoxylon trugodes]|uniref:uncharacterized protein n=1 Tax=Hypoxylon trugodes TaxID=326681 RepID=UPI002193FBDB|nr:uncharacterized protein F4822DRAFT_427820 [Hypoxylon trugodes]KAI1389472.1 hypothetical protein F4822DRAFT_427820 [Hypoxylon trugodes]